MFLSASWSRQVASLGGYAVLRRQHPCRSLLEPAVACANDVARDQVLDQLPHDVAVGAQHGVVQLRVGQELVQAIETMAFRQLDRMLDRELAGAAHALDGLHAAQIRAGEDGREREGFEDGDELLRLLLTFLAQRAETVVARPVAAAAGLGVPDYVDGAQVSSS